MKSETIQQQRERLRAQTEAEREGAEAAGEGQLTIRPTDAQIERAEQIDQVAEATERALVESQGAVYTNDVPDEGVRPEQAEQGEQPARRGRRRGAAQKEQGDGGSENA
jgi:hypothetical protein